MNPIPLYDAINFFWCPYSPHRCLGIRCLAWVCASGEEAAQVETGCKERRHAEYGETCDSRCGECIFRMGRCVLLVDVTPSPPVYRANFVLEADS